MRVSLCVYVCLCMCMHVYTCVWGVHMEVRGQLWASGSHLPSGTGTRVFTLDQQVLYPEPSSSHPISHHFANSSNPSSGQESFFYHKKEHLACSNKDVWGPVWCFRHRHLGFWHPKPSAPGPGVKLCSPSVWKHRRPNSYQAKQQRLGREGRASKPPP